MADLKLPRLPDRNPVKLTVALPPELHDDVVAYAQAYAEAYGREEPVGELIVAMVGTFLTSDRAFQKRRAAQGDPR